MSIHTTQLNRLQTIEACYTPFRSQCRLPCKLSPTYW